MLNVHSAGKVPYLKASPLRQHSYFDRFKLVILVILDIVKVILIILVKILILPISVWLRNGPKNIYRKTALITGGANGIGKAVALELAECGCNIIIADIDKSASEKTLEVLQKYDIKSLSYSIDVSNPEDVENLKEEVEKSIGPVDILINNAGLMPLASLREGRPADVKRIVDVNINANFWTIRTFLPGMIQRKIGHIVQISSMSALHPIPGAIVYTATKYAVTGLMLALEEELRQEGSKNNIDFTTVHPYFVSTRLDLMNLLNLRFPAITAEYTAKEIVKGIIHRKRRVVIPHFDVFLTALLPSLPYMVQWLVRDHILREPETRIVKDPFVYVS
ncbi:uncharacterized oxidoreductase SSP0419-like [Episyrphus balteatus]|uniref:uncharacterized oxidoreductase SSP0419-like n=1 Tax=Episyrphus balteatus TaxID=286459 RepID=UPI002485DB8C|nr:uncharacterized oxidoreductase SSP0419-like [Episyrphus balteatus]